MASHDVRNWNQRKRQLCSAVAVPGLVTLLLFSTVGDCIEHASSNITVPSDENVSSSIEEEVLGPLRIWHIVFIVFSILLIAIVAMFCCVDIRVPRSRQEIEDNYKKRLLNQSYVRMLEKSPEQLMRQSDYTSKLQPEIAVISSNENKRTTSRDSRQQQQQKTPKDWKQVTRTAVSKTSTRQDNEGRTGISMLGNMSGQQGGPRPLGINPKDILAIMAQRSQNKSSNR